jgi:hypothetical protein
LTDNDFLTPTRPRTRGITVVVVVVAVCAAAVAVTGLRPWQVTGSIGSPSVGRAQAPGVPVPGAAPGASLPAPSGAASADVVDDLPPAGQVAVLPRGTTTVGTFRTGYPRTLRGAVAAAVEYTGHGGCLDTACVDALTRAALDPAWTRGRAEELAGTRKARAMLGIPEGQPVPAGAVLTPTPMAYQILPAPADTVPANSDPAADHGPRVRVMLLLYAAMAGPAISPRNTLFALPANLHWTDGDWKLTAGDRSYPELVAQPGTPQAAALGWREFAA